MGYFTKDIAKESKKPAIVSLSGNTNYIQFESLNDSSQNKHIEISLQVISTEIDIDKSAFVIIESESNNRHEFIGTKDREEVNNTTFLF